MATSPPGGIGTPPPVSSWIRNAPIAVLVAAAFLAWSLPTLAMSVVVWLVIEAGVRWLQVLRSGGVLHLPTLVGVKAAAIGVCGVAMLIAPGLGEGERDEPLPTMARAATYFWSTPLGVVFVAVGAIGLRAALRSRGAGSTGDMSPTDAAAPSRSRRAAVR